jgi:gamma-glutamylcyclotransferase (GGCT)/AIG2-like uncharacterized protein YtfP
MQQLPADGIMFAYGSNLNMRQMEYRCPDAVPIGPAILIGYELSFRGNRRGVGVATVDPRPGYQVPGGLWKITDKCLVELDRYEGYPHLYDREEVEGVTSAGQRVTAFTYRMTPGHVIVPPSRYYYDVIREGYSDFTLEEDPLLIALYESKQSLIKFRRGAQ